MIRLAVLTLCGCLTITSCRERQPNGPVIPATPPPASQPSVPHQPTTDPGTPVVDRELTKDVLPSIPGLDPRALTGSERKLMELADPASEREEWSSEAFSDAASTQLKVLAGLLSGGKAEDANAFDAVISADFTGAIPDPQTLQTILRDDLVDMRRSVPGDAKALTFRGSTGQAMDALMAPHAGATDVRVHFKTFRYHEENQVPVTTSYFQSVGRLPSGFTQQNAVWICRWTRDSPPRIIALTVTDYERVEPVYAAAHDHEGGLRFVDVTRAVAGDASSIHGQMTIGAGHWAGRLDKFYQIDTTGHQGLAIGDVDDDGLDDLYVLQQGGLPNRLYLQQPDGTLRDVSEPAGVDWMELSHAALLIDLDNDGDQDLAIAQSTQILIMENTGGARFQIRHEGPGLSNYFSLAAADYDADGDLDVFACGYGRRNTEEYADGARVTVPLPYHDSRNGGPNALLRNEGGWRFSDVTKECGLDENNDRHSFAAAWEDYDNDGDPDLYVANDFGRNNLYKNLGRDDRGVVRFQDVAAMAGVEDMSAGMGVTWGDYDRDGHMDIYVSNMFSAAGNRITYQRQFRPEGDAATLAGLRRHARGNSLFRNKGDGTFVDVSVEAGVTMGRWAWGAQFADFNNDGWQDLYVVNGYITGQTQDDL